MVKLNKSMNHNVFHYYILFPLPIYKKNNIFLYLRKYCLVLADFSDQRKLGY